MLDDAADVIEREFRQTRVAIAREQVFATLPNRHMHMHARTVIADDGFGHEGCGLTITVRDVMHHILETLVPVGALDECFKLGANFALASVRNFVVMHFHFHADILKCYAHCRADILQLIHWRHRKVATFDGRPMTEITAFKFRIC